MCDAGVGNSTHKRGCGLTPRASLAVLSNQLAGLDGEVKRWLLKADQHLKWEEFESAVPFLESVIVRTSVYPRLQLLLWELLGNAQMALGASKKASVCYLHHLAFCRSLGDFRGLTRAECSLGIAYTQLGLLKLAGRCFLQYLGNSRRLEDQAGVECACSNLGLLSRALALRQYTAAAVSQEGEGEGPGGGGGGGNVAAMSAVTTCLRRAIIFFKQHLEIVLTHGDLEKQGRAYGNIGSCYELLRDYPEAIFYHQKRLEVTRATGDMYSELCTLCNLGNCFRAKGNLKQALQHYLINLEMAQSLGDRKMEQLSHNNLGVTYELLNQLDKAISSYTLFLGMAVQSGELKKQARGFSVLGRLYLESGQTTKAHEYYHNLVGVFQKLGDHTSFKSVQLQLKFIGQLMKCEKRKGRGHSAGGHTSSKQKRLRAHTLSRASNFDREVATGPTSLSGRGLGTSRRSRDLQDKTGTWSMGKKPCPQLNPAPIMSEFISDDFAPDPILAMADFSPSWAGPGQGAGLAGRTGHGHELSSSYPLQPVSSRRPRYWSTCDQSYDRSFLLHHQDAAAGCNNISNNAARQQRCHRHGSDNTLYSMQGGPPRQSSGETLVDNISYHSTSSTPQHRHSHTHPSEMLYDSRRCGYEMVGPPHPPPPPPHSASGYSSAGDSTAGRSTALPSLSYCSSPLTNGSSSTTSFLGSEGRGSPGEEHRDHDNGPVVADQGRRRGPAGGGGRGSCCYADDDVVVTEDEDEHLRELQRAGLELARAGLELAGFDAEGVRELEMEEGADKEWEQWQQMNEDSYEPGNAFGSSLASVAGTNGQQQQQQGRKKRKHSRPSMKRRLHAVSAPNL